MSQGNRYNQGKLRWRNFPMFLFEPVVQVGDHAEKRADNPKGKYDTFNFLKGLKMNDTLDALKRHLMKFESPYESDFDNETGLNHLAHVAWNAIVALHFYKTRPDLDDRYKLSNNMLDKTPSEKELDEVQKMYKEMLDSVKESLDEEKKKREVKTMTNMYIKGNE